MVRKPGAQRGTGFAGSVHSAMSAVEKKRRHKRHTGTTRINSGENLCRFVPLCRLATSGARQSGHSAAISQADSAGIVARELGDLWLHRRFHKSNTLLHTIASTRLLWKIVKSAKNKIMAIISGNATLYKKSCLWLRPSPVWTTVNTVHLRKGEPVWSTA